MKIVHTGDWHIGKIINQRYMTEDQAYILGELTRLLTDEKPDLLVIAGDIYDRAVPPVEAVELVDQTLSHILLKLQIPIMMIAGNHDSPDRVGFGSRLLRSQGLYIAGRIENPIQPIQLSDKFGPIHFYLIPYAAPTIIREVFAAPEVKDHDSAMEAMMKNLRLILNKEVRNVLVTHGFVRGAGEPERSDSEKPLSLKPETLGGTEFVSVHHFNPFCYTALGHLHGAQKVGTDCVRYAGSLLKYSFSEERQHKSVSVVEIDEAGEVQVTLQPLKPKQDMRTLSGNLETLLNPDFYGNQKVDDYLRVILTDEGEVLDPMNKLRAVYPNVLELGREGVKKDRKESRTSAGVGYRQKSELQLFEDFYCHLTDQEWTTEKKTMIAETIEKVDLEDRRA